MCSCSISFFFFGQPRCPPLFCYILTPGGEEQDCEEEWQVYFAFLGYSQLITMFGFLDSLTVNVETSAHRHAYSRSIMLEHVQVHICVCVLVCTKVLNWKSKKCCLDDFLFSLYVPFTTYIWVCMYVCAFVSTLQVCKSE